MNIPNDKLKKQYLLFLKYLTQKKPTCNETVLLVYYSILQDGVMTALSVFKQFVCEDREGRFVPLSDCLWERTSRLYDRVFGLFHRELDTELRDLCSL